MQNELPFSRSLRRYWLLLAIALATLVLVVVTLLFTRPLPPRTVVMATGPEGGAYHGIGERYRDFFASHGVTLDVRTTSGPVNNIELLNDPGSDVGVAIVESGITSTGESPNLVTLGTVFYEPFWWFSGIGPIESLEAIQGMRISLGAPGSGTHKLGRKILALIELDPARMQMQELRDTEAGEALMRGELDLVGMSQPWEADIVQRLLRDPGVEALGWPHADAYVALRPYLSKRILPRGVADLRTDRPPHDVTLVASKASLVVRDDMHPALQHLFLEAASEIHSVPGVFNKAGEFPAAEPIDVPLSNTARQYYRSGKPFLQHYLPFWLAAFTSRLLVLLIPILGIVYPLSRLLPALYDWSMRHRILRLYGELKLLETKFDMNATGASAAALEQLNRLEKRVNRMRVPVAFNQMLYTLKQHINLARERIPHHPSRVP